MLQALLCGHGAERTRAALIVLFQRAPPVHCLVLDEPTRSLDFDAVPALQRALRARPGGLIVTGDDEDFLESLGIDRWLATGEVSAARPGPVSG